jgi:hypothetical protein
MVLVFRTNINESLERNARHILSVFSEIIQIDFDFEDRDNILRIEAVQDITLEVELALNSKGFYCGALH